MNPLLKHSTSQHLLAASLMMLILLAQAPAVAGPGAHGPNGEHLDSPVTVSNAAALPRIEAHTEAFELVAELRANELIILIDRYQSNEPVLGATLEVESGPLKAVAAFRADQGDYAVTDAAMLKALAAPGEHALVFTLVAGKDSDLLDGTLVTAAAGAAAAGKADPREAQGHADHSHDHRVENAAWIAAGVAALGLICGALWWRQRRNDAGKLQGGLS